MKLILLLLISCSCAAQKGATTIIVKADLKTVATALMDQGYIIDEYNTELGTIITKPNDFDEYLWTLVVQVRVKDSLAYIKGRYKALGYDIPVSNTGTKISIPKISFKKLQEVAEAISKDLTYL